MNMKVRLIILNFLQFAVWGSYLTSMGAYLATAGLGTDIGNYYALQGVVSIFMPALMGIVADRWVPAQRLLSFCHFMAALFMGVAAWVGLSTGDGEINRLALFSAYSMSVAFYMPTLALSNSVAYNALDKAGLDTVTSFPPIRVFGTIGFLCAMWLVDFAGWQNTPIQFVESAVFSVVMALYSLSMPNCPVGSGDGKKTSFVDALGLKAFALFKDKKMAYFFIFSFLLGVSLQITNGYANPYIQSFGDNPEYQGLFFVNHSNLLISLSQVSETLCILLIPYFLKRYGIKIVMLISMFAWVGRFGFFGLGDPAMPGVLLFVLSCIVYGVAFDFFNVSGSLFVDRETDSNIRSSAQGLFMLMTNGLGATFGSLGAKVIINHNVYQEGLTVLEQSEGWRNSWYIFAAYALVVALAFAVLFKYKHVREPK